MVLSDRQFSGKLLLEGSIERPGEIVFFGAAADEGFLLARLIGSEMQVEKAVLLAKALEREGALDNAVEAVAKIL
jgi:ABC-type antimicrobial peptide transport system permease subunit